ncbi:hypothetical protein [Streptomyces sp. 184]|uniref:hypothetical protein n=1 Tax=Streptomyces sp. 184 TaxID=1827526 RepID=UPI00389162F7
MGDWWSIEVSDAHSSALRWKDAYEYALVESALGHRATTWEWHVHSRGIVFEIAFREKSDGEAWRQLPGVRAALDAVPDPAAGLLVRRGPDGNGCCRGARRPRPAPAAAAVESPDGREAAGGVANTAAQGSGARGTAPKPPPRAG